MGGSWALIGLVFVDQISAYKKIVSGKFTEGSRSKFTSFVEKRNKQKTIE